MSIKHFELAAKDHSLTFSPFCWRTRMALLHKGLSFTTEPWFFSDKSATAQSDSDKVPTIQDGDNWVSDSWKIAEYLDKQYPDSPALLTSPMSVSLAKLVESICSTHLFPAVVPVVLNQVHNILGEDCQAYFRQTREAFFGTELENITIDVETGKKNIADALASFDALLAEQDFICGEEPGYADYILYGVLKWVDVVTKQDMLGHESKTAQWFVSVDNLYNGHGAKARKVRA